MGPTAATDIAPGTSSQAVAADTVTNDGDRAVALLMIPLAPYNSMSAPGPATSFCLRAPPATPASNNSGRHEVHMEMSLLAFVVFRWTPKPAKQQTTAQTTFENAKEKYKNENDSEL